MSQHSDNMRTDSDSFGPSPRLDQVFQAFWDAKQSGPAESAEKLAALAPVLSSSLQNSAQGMLRRDGAPNPQHNAEDVSQSWIATMLDRGARLYDPNRGCFRYSVVSLRNEARDILRDLRRRKAVPISDACVSKDKSPCAQAMRRERRSQVRSAVRRLPRAMRRIVKAKYWFGLRSKQIAMLLDIKVSAVDRLAFLARQRLREELSGSQLGD